MAITVLGLVRRPGARALFDGLRPWLRVEDRLRIEQEIHDTMVIRAEMPGIDPGKDAPAMKVTFGPVGGHDSFLP